MRELTRKFLRRDASTYTICIACALILPGRAVAQDVAEDVPTITLADALRRAQRDPPAVFVAYAALLRAQAEIGRARAAWAPALTSSASGGYTYDHRALAPNTSPLDSQTLELRGTLSLEWAALDLARGSRIDAADAAERASSFDLESTRTRAAFLVAELYLRAGAAIELVKDAELSLTRRDHQYEAAQQLVKGGTRSPLDAQRAQVEVVSARYALALRQSEEQASFAALAAALGRPADQLLRPATNTATFRAVAETPARAKELARLNRPELRGAAANVTAQRHAYDAAVNERWPTLGAAANATAGYVDVQSGYAIDGTQYGGTGAVYLRWQGLDPSVWSKASVANASANIAERERDALLQSITSEAVGAYYAFERAKIGKQRAVAVLEAAEVTREAQNSRYTSGLASLLELLDAEDLEQQARQARIEAERDEAIAAAQVQSACGLLTR